MRIGITMRIVENTAYPEQRDALSKDWSDYIAEILPQAVLIPIVNQPKAVPRIIKDLGIDALILSNGAGWGEEPQRDETEKIIADYCLEQDIPVLGVCRGLQILNVIFNGKVEKDIAKVSGENHIAKHEVFIDDKFRRLCPERTITVNSFHNQGVMVKGVAGEFAVFAKTGAGVVEGIYHFQKPVMAIQWHPERNNPTGDFDRKLITEFLSKGRFWDK